MKVVFDLDDVLWLVEHLPAIKDTDNKPRFLRVMAVLHEAMDDDASMSHHPGGFIRILSYKFKVEAVKFIRSITGMTLKEAMQCMQDPTKAYWVPAEVDVHFLADQMNIKFEWANVTPPEASQIASAWTVNLPASPVKITED